MNIVHINTHDVAGGAAKVAMRLMLAQKSGGHNARMIVGTKSSSDANIQSFELQADPMMQEFYKKSGLLYYEFLGSHNLTNHPWIQEADIIHLHNLHGNYFNPYSLLLLSRIKPVVWTLHDMQSFTGYCAHAFSCKKWQTGCGNCPDLEIYPKLFRDTSSLLLQDKELLYKQAQCTITVPSAWLQEYTKGSVLRTLDCRLVYNPVDTAIFKPGNKSALRNKYNIPQDTFLIAGVAQGGALGNSWKGGTYTLQVLDAVIRDFPNTLFLNIGSKLNSGHKNIIDIQNIADETELSEIYALSDVYLTTTVADNAPLTVIEALSCGLPVVSFATGGIPEMVKHDCTGYITGYKNVPETIEAVSKLQHDRTLVQNMGIQARTHAVEKYHANLIVRQFEEIYLSAVTSHAKADNTSVFKVPPEIQTPIFLNQANFILKDSHSTQANQVINSRASSIPSISVILIQSDSPESDRECLYSILGQEYPNFEVHIIGESKTRFPDFAEHRCARSIVHIQSAPESTRSDKLKLGFELVSGDIITWIDGCDKFHPGAFFKVAESMLTSPDLQWVCGRPSVWGINGSLHSISETFKPISLNELLNYTVSNPLLTQPGVFVKRELWISAGNLFDSSFEEHAILELFLRLMRTSSLQCMDALLAGKRSSNDNVIIHQDLVSTDIQRLIIDRERSYYSHRQATYERRAIENNGVQPFRPLPFQTAKTIYALTQQSNTWRTYFIDLFQILRKSLMDQSTISLCIQNQFADLTDLAS